MPCTAHVGAAAHLCSFRNRVCCPNPFSPSYAASHRHLVTTNGCLWVRRQSHYPLHHLSTSRCRCCCCTCCYLPTPACTNWPCCFTALSCCCCLLLWCVPAFMRCYSKQCCRRYRRCLCPCYGITAIVPTCFVIIVPSGR